MPETPRPQPQDVNAETLARWDAAAAADPQEVDALYNAGQYLYNQGDFRGALQRWEMAADRAPDDLEIRKKIVQALFALGEGERGDAALDALRQAWAESRDPEVQRWNEVVFDQLLVGGHRVLVTETLRPPRQDLYYVVVWRVFDPSDRVRLTVQLETSAYARERGVPYLFGVNTPRGHATVGPMFKERPPYLALREIAVKLIARELGAAAG